MVSGGGCLPQSWKDAHVTAIFKKEKKSTPGNYRPVSLTSIECKVMESLGRNQVVDHMATNQLFTANQHRFLNGRSCTTNLLAVLDALVWSTRDGSCSGCCIWSFRRACGDLLEVFKYTYNAYNVNANLLPIDTGLTLFSTTRREFKLKKRFCQNAMRANFFSFRVVNSWNRLPPSVVTAPTLNFFKARLNRVCANLII